MKTTPRGLALGFALSAAALAAGSAGAAPPEPAAGGPFLLGAPEFQRELKLSPAQVAKVGPTLRALDARRVERTAALEKAPPRERLAGQRKLLKDVTAAARADLELTPAQAARFDQVVLQHRRFSAFTDPEVVAKLRLTPDQKQAIDRLARGAFERMKTISGLNKTDPGAGMRLAAGLSLELAEKAVALLTPEQAATWKAMTGPPFELGPRP